MRATLFRGAGYFKYNSEWKSYAEDFSKLSTSDFSKIGNKLGNLKHVYVQPTGFEYLCELKKSPMNGREIVLGK